jgi:hypothetical protein
MTATASRQKMHWKSVVPKPGVQILLEILVAYTSSIVLSSREF